MFKSVVEHTCRYAPILGVIICRGRLAPYRCSPSSGKRLSGERKFVDAMIVGTASVTLAHRENLTDKVQGCESQTARTRASEVWWFTLELIDGSIP